MASMWTRVMRAGREADGVGLRIRGLWLNFGREFARIRELGDFGPFRPNLALLFVT